jgi:hypothetical protein
MPKKLIELDESKLKFLEPDTARVLFAAAEAVVGDTLRLKVPNFIPMIDDYVGCQRRSRRGALRQGVKALEGLIVSLFFGRTLRGFSRLTIQGRQRILERVSRGGVQQFRNLFAACVNNAAPAFYASEATRAEIHCAGVSVGHTEILGGTPPPPPPPRPVHWRAGDPRPVER